jgi:hypothetical protein
MNLKAGFVFCITLATGGIGFASPSGSPSPEEENPCKTISSACESAGYVKHGKGKNLWRDCMHPILSGQSVEGVQVNAADVRACEARKAEQPHQ